MELAEISGQGIAKRLASCKESTRNRAVCLLCSWLPKQNTGPSAAGLSDPELIKIWKGLFFCVWHSDKLPAQIELINRLAALLSSLPSQLAGRFLESFLITIRREWSGIDFLRLDKFYILIRRFLRHVFILLKNNYWNIDITTQIAGILSHRSFLSDDKFPAAGVNYHIAEIFLDEITEFLPLSKETVDLMLNPFISVMQTSTDKILVNKIKVNIFDRLAVNGSNLLNNVEASSDSENLGKIGLAIGFSKRLFYSASATETHQSNRKVLFGLHDTYLKLEKELEKSGLDISMKQTDIGILVPDNACDMEITTAFTNGSCSNIREAPDIGLIKKKKAKKPDSDISVPENDCNMETTNVFTNGSCRDIREAPGIGPIKKKKANKVDNYISAQENVCNLETTDVFTDGSACDIKEEPDNGSIKKAKKASYGTVSDSKIKKNKKKSLCSSTESNVNGSGKRSKSKKHKLNLADSSSSSKGNSTEATRSDYGGIANNENCNQNSSDSNDVINFDDTLLSNLQKQFERVAVESGMISGSSAKVSKKRKRTKNSDNKQIFEKSETTDVGSETGKSADMNIKKVRFSMNNNLIWKPQNPLPPQSLRLPPSVTPRGSALKKGLSPGPIRESPPTVKKIKINGSSMMKVRKKMKTVSPAVKHFRLLQGFLT